MAATQLKTIGIREFREHLARHMSGDTPLAITRHGFTIGYYIPVHQSVSETDLQTLEDATQRLQALLETRGINPEDLSNDYTALRKARRKTRGETALAKVQC
jgi:hypothetical protein